MNVNRRRRLLHLLPPTRAFSSSARRCVLGDISTLPPRVQPRYNETSDHNLLSLHWPQPIRNLLVVAKRASPVVARALVDFVHHAHSTYPDVSVVLEPHVAESIHDQFASPIYVADGSVADKIDLTSTLGGDGTILHAASLFHKAVSVPPILSFSMGTLGFLGEWKFDQHKRALSQVYMSGAATRPGSGGATLSTSPPHASRVLLRNRLEVVVNGSDSDPSDSHPSNVYAMNEVLLHRGSAPHLCIIDIYVGGRFLTEALADGLLISTPTGSTAYSLSSGGSIVHPLVSSLLLTPICPRSLSFRPLILPGNTPITLRLSEKNRGDEIQVSVDGVRWDRGLQRGMEVRVVGEEIRSRKGEWGGGVPSIVGAGEMHGQDPWVGGLNSLLKFNYPFGEDG